MNFILATACAAPSVRSSWGAVTRWPLSPCWGTLPARSSASQSCVSFVLLCVCTALIQSSDSPHRPLCPGVSGMRHVFTHAPWLTAGEVCLSPVTGTASPRRRGIRASAFFKDALNPHSYCLTSKVSQSIRMLVNKKSQWSAIRSDGP
ncbi:hypothetical protein H1C71_037733, partial [Ictidomys tridecemlineatus]